MPAIKPTTPHWQSGDVLAANCAAYYCLNEGSGTTVADLTPAGRTGILQNAGGWGTGQFSGPDLAVGNNLGCRIDIADVAGFQQAGAFSVSVWVKLSSIAVSQCFLSCFTAEGGNAGWALGIDDSTPGKLKWFHVLGGSLSILNSTTILTAGTWYNIIGTFAPGTPGVRKLWINGALDASDAPSGTITYSNGAGGPYAVIGAAKISATNPIQPTQGDLDVPSVYSVDLGASPSLIADIQADDFTPARGAAGPFTSGSISQVGTATVSTLNLQVGAASNGVGTVHYQWQRSPYGAGTWSNVGTDSTSLALTGLPYGTSYDFRVVAADSTSPTPQTATSATFSASTLWPMDYPDVSRTLANWYQQGGSPADWIASSNAGASFRAGFGGTSFRLILDLAPLTAAGASLNGTVGHRWTVDGADLQSTTTTAGTMTLAAGLANTSHWLEYLVGTCSPFVDRWTNGLIRPIGILLDLGATLLAPPAAPADSILGLADSILEGSGAAPDGTSSAAHSYFRYVAEALGYRAAYSGFASTGYGVGFNAVPALGGQIGYYSSGKARVLTGLFAGGCLLVHGRNDTTGGTLAATVAADLAAIRTAIGAGYPIYQVIPFARTCAADILAGFQSYGGTTTSHDLGQGAAYYDCSADPDAHLIDLGTNAAAGLGGGATEWSVDGTHLNTRGSARVAPMIVGAIRTIQARRSLGARSRPRISRSR